MLAGRLTACETIDLRIPGLRPFGYGTATIDDDAFRIIIHRLGEAGDIVFATPVYWYAMSGVMKTFFDRLSDLLIDPKAKPLGRALAGRRIWVLATGTDADLPDGFTEPFARTAAYFDCRWCESCYVRVADDALVTKTTKRIADFADTIRATR